MKKWYHLWLTVALTVCVAMLCAAAASAQTINIDKAIKSDLGGNQTNYEVAGTVDGVGNNYRVELHVYDANDAVIDVQQITVTDGSPDWSMEWTAVAGGVRVKACLRDDPGLRRPTQDCDDEDWRTFRHHEPVPSLTEWGLIVLVLLIITAAAIAIRRRRAMAAA